MTLRRDHRRWRLALAWGLSGLLLTGYVLLGEEEKEGGSPPPVQSADTPAEDAKLEIVQIDPSEPNPGGAVEIHFIGRDAKNPAPLRAFLTGKEEAEVLDQRSDTGTLVIRIPESAKPGRNKVRIQQGSDEDRRSKPYDMRIKQSNRRKQFRNIVGGLALLVFGLRIMSRGSRTYTGQRSQGILARIGRRTAATMGLGIVVGGVVQFTTTAAGLVVGLVESHLLTVGPAMALLLGAQLGSAAAPSVLGLASTNAGLLVVGIGAILLSLAIDRRSEAFGKIILGCGLLFYGLQMLRNGFEPLVSDPEILPYIDRFRADGFSGTFACAAAGVLLAAVLQGPAPVFVLVLSLAQTSGRLDLQSALAVLSGTGLGASIGTMVVAWPFGSEARRLGRLHFALALIGTILLASTVDAWAYAADALMSGHPGEMAFGKKVLLPYMGSHLVVAFALSQGAATILLAAVMGPVAKMLQRLAPTVETAPRALTGEAGIAALRTGLVRVLRSQRAALMTVVELCTTGHRGRGRESEHTLADARAELEGLFAGAVRTHADGGPETEQLESIRLRQAALATVQLQRAIEDLLRHAERGTEQRMALAPAGESWQLNPRDEATIKALHALLLEGIDALVQQLESGRAPDTDAARAREIQLNAMESETRQALLIDSNGTKQTTHAIALRLNSADLVNAYESVGNHIYRLSETLAAEVDQDV